MQYDIDRVNSASFEQVLPLIAEYQRFYGCEPDEARNRKFFGELLDDDTYGLQLSARAGDRVVGFVTLYWTRTSTQATTVALLNDLYVHPDFRGGRENGVGAELMRAAARAAAERGYPSLNWETAPDNRSGQALYDRFLTEAPAPGSKSSWIHYGYPLPPGPTA
ncbi:GNAT family N-acetyltransferase [Streptomyces gobiensis]|uniref:GNAT family N-acetyltransferase n=1 Tax=Streptomyces gobiensis TaxID=2875706 RepID=UPI001E4CAB87|nr:GNAT family N-acetyltransferase [Streptomyces gobiensis]UGY91989.1 GNAT family N-acetyltransferase [Streptomyces gobiensis]